MRRLLAVALSLLLSCQTVAALESAAVPTAAQSFAPLIEQTAPAVVNIYSQKRVRSRTAARFLDGSAFWQLFRDTLLFGYGKERIENALGSGVIVSADGIVVTNHHVIEGAEGILVALADGRNYFATILLSDSRSDIAVLRVHAGTALPFLEWGDSDLLKIGDQVLAIGNPYGLGQTVTSGIVSALARTSFGVGDFRYFIQTDAAINPGNSGGAQITMNGKLIGINTAIYTTSGGSQGLGFAIPSNMVRGIVENAMAGKPLVRPWIGLSGQSLSIESAAALRLATTRGVLVTGVYQGGPADAAGLRPGDVVLAIDQFRVDDPQALRYRIATQALDKPVKLTIVRAGALASAVVSLQPPPETPPRDEVRMPLLSPLRGARVASLSPALAEEIGLDSSLTGVVVLSVGRGSAAQRFGIAKGDVIRMTDGDEIHTAEELLKFRSDPFKQWSIVLTRAGRTVTMSRPSPSRLVQ